MINSFISLILLLYSFNILRYLYGWRINSFDTKSSYFPKVSVVIAVRNEENNILKLLSDLSLQDYPQDLFNIIIVNDHSTDGTLDLLNQELSKYPNLILHNLTTSLEGKKSAINTGVNISNHEIILSSDADCSFPNTWISSMVSGFNDKQIKLVSGPVTFYKESSLFNKLQTLEFLSLIGAGAGAIGIGNPIFCNGANMAYRRETYKKVFDTIDLNIASGDDVFLLHAIKRKYKSSVRFIKDVNAVVYTNAVEGFDQFINQRKRWAAKSTSFKDAYTIYTSILVLLVNFSTIYLLFFSLFHVDVFFFFLWFFLIKNIVDILFLSNVLSFFSRKDLLKWMLFFQIFYSFYIVLVSFLSQLQTFSWKKRLYKK